MRRCVYFHVEFPRPEEMREIVRARLPGLADDVGLVADALSLFYQYRGENGGPQIRKQPSTAELIDFVNAVAADPAWRERAQRRALFEQYLSALIKTTEDRKIAVDHVRNWTSAGLKACQFRRRPRTSPRRLQWRGWALAWSGA